MMTKNIESKNQQKMIQRHIWQDYSDVAEDLRHNHEIKEIYGKRKETIDHVFADAKKCMVCDGQS